VLCSTGRPWTSNFESSADSRVISGASPPRFLQKSAHDRLTTAGQVTRRRDQQTRGHRDRGLWVVDVKCLRLMQHPVCVLSPAMKGDDVTLVSANWLVVVKILAFKLSAARRQLNEFFSLVASDAEKYAKFKSSVFRGKYTFGESIQDVHFQLLVQWTF